MYDSTFIVLCYKVFLSLDAEKKFLSGVWIKCNLEENQKDNEDR